VLFSTSGYISHMRMAPDGKSIAFFNHPADLDDRGSLDIVDLKGHRSTLMDGAATEEGLAWRSDSKEIWFTASREGHNLRLSAVSLRGEQRTIFGIPGSVVLHDIAADGRLLLCSDSRRVSIYARGPADAAERDLSWFDGSILGDLSRDGKVLTFTEVSEAMGQSYGVCMRNLSGGAPVRLGAGFSGGQSPDGRYVIGQDPDTEVLTALPTGAGEPHVFALSSGVNGVARWLPDSRAIVIFGRKNGKTAGYRYDFPSGTPHAIAGAAVLQNAFDLAITVDGLAAAVDDRTTGRLWIIPLDGSKSREVPGARPFDRPVQWADANTLYVRPGSEIPAAIDLLDVTTGSRRPWKTLGPADRSGQQQMFSVAITGDGSAYGYTVSQEVTQLFLASGFN
jgi:Tol biopolymer transport system component